MQRRQFSPEFRQQVVKEAREVGNCALVARKYDLAHSIVSKWARKSANNSANQQAPDLSNDHKEILAENDQLKKLLGKKELEIEILRDLLKKTNPNYKIK